MRYIPTGEQMKKADRFTIDTVGIPSMVLMERAALGCVEQMETLDLDFRRILVVCGSGNNGGDGYAIARLLHLKGYAVDIFFAGSEERRSEENRKQKDICEFYNLYEVHSLNQKEYSIIVDCIFGTGLTRPLAGAYASVVDYMNRMNGVRIAIDMPSGIQNTEDDNEDTTVFSADYTFAIAYCKQELYLHCAGACAGVVYTIDIGITPKSFAKDERMTYAYEIEDLRKLYPARKQNSHKGDYGKVLIIAGSEGMAGAAYLSAKAAYASGAGLVRIYTAKENRVVLQELLPEAILTTYDEYDKSELLEVLSWADTVVIGPGLSTGSIAQELVHGVLKHADMPCVLDADALNIISWHKEWLLEAKQPLVVTPHMKEMSRLLDCTVKELAQDRFTYLTTFTEAYALVCVLKDARTLVAQSGHDVYLNLSGSHAMAKGGSGDVLTGIIAGIIAQGKSPYHAATIGVYLHGLAGDRAREKKGSYSVLASDIIDGIGEVLYENL